MKALRIIPEQCTGCMRCELACSYQQTGMFQPAKSVIRVSSLEAHTSYAPYTCLQCAEGWCMTACPVDAITISPVEAKLVSQDQCVGCKLCTIACPYGTIFYDGDTHKAVKCDLCGGDPACAEVCPTSAIQWMQTENADWLGEFAAQRSSFDLTGRAGAT
jgi:Fe-S-cluster-containing hydrogenase component 2